MLWIATVSGATDAALTSSQATSVVEGFHDALLIAMRAQGSVQSRFEYLAPIVDEVFDVDTITRISIGTTWRTMSGVQRDEFVGLMRELVTVTYAKRFSKYESESFATAQAQPSRAGRWIVKTRLTTSDGDIVTLDYHLQEAGVFNVVANGVSDLALRRADYAATIERVGLGGLAEALRASIKSASIKSASIESASIESASTSSDSSEGRDAF